MKNSISSIALAIVVILSSCGDKQAPVEAAKSPAPPERIVIGNEDEAVRSQVIYSMPTPNELFELINNMDVAVDKHVLYDVSMARSATDTLTKAFRFGMCATDLVYASYFDIPTEVVRYYLTTRQLSAEIGIERAFNSIDVQRLERNISYGDSLTIITNEAYLRAYEQLDADARGDVLAMVLAGGWVETTHLLIEQIGTYDESNVLLDRLVEQKFGLSQLVDLMELNSGEEEITELRARLLSIRDIFDHVSVTRIKEDPDHATGRRVLGGEETFDLSPVKFEEIRQAVLALRGSTHNF